MGDHSNRLTAAEREIASAMVYAIEASVIATGEIHAKRGATAKQVARAATEATRLMLRVFAAAEAANAKEAGRG